MAKIMCPITFQFSFSEYNAVVINKYTENSEKHIKWDVSQFPFLIPFSRRGRRASMTPSGLL